MEVSGEVLGRRNYDYSGSNGLRCCAGAVLEPFESGDSKWKRQVCVSLSYTTNPRLSSCGWEKSKSGPLMRIY